MPAVHSKHYGGPMRQNTRGRRPALKKPTMKKVSKRGAYKKNVKNQMALRRAPIVETKQRVASDIARLNGFQPGDYSGPESREQPLNWTVVPADDAFTFVPVDTFMRIQRGLEEWEVIGSNYFAKFLNSRFEFRFPDNKDITLFSTQSNEVGGEVEPAGTPYQVTNKMIEHPTKLYLICGWVTQNFNAPINPLKDQYGALVPGQRPARDECSQGQLKQYIVNQLQPYFDDDTDKLEFRPKATTNIKIEKYVRIKPDLSHAIGTEAIPRRESIQTNDVKKATGSIPDVRKSWSQKLNRKVELTQGLNTTYSTDNQNLYPNDSWLPFQVIYNPNYEPQLENTTMSTDPKLAGRFTQVQMIQYRHNNSLYFTDS